MNAIYIRVSTEDQAKHGYSIKIQRQSCRERLAENGIHSNIEEFIDDGFSGEFLERPALSRLRELVSQGGVGTLTIYDPDRMSRNLTNQLILADEIEKAGVKLMFATGDYDVSPEGRLFFAMKGAVAAYEKAKIRERTSRGRRQKAAAGKIVLNARPYGYGWDGKTSMYTVDEEQAAIVRLIYDLFLNRKMGCRGIATELKRMGISGPKGKTLSDCTVHKILSREMYCGTHYLFRQRVQKIGQNRRLTVNLPPEDWLPVSVPAIVTREIWEKAQRQLKENKKPAGRASRNLYLLQGVLRCLYCGKAMIATTRPAKRKTTAAKLYSYYTCVSKESHMYALSGERCQGMRIPVRPLDSRVWEILVSAAQDREGLPAATYEQKRQIIRNAGLTVYAARSAKTGTVSFYFD